MIGEKMDKKSFLQAVRFVKKNTKLTDEDKAILDAYLTEIPDAVVADKLAIDRDSVKGKRQNICAKLGSAMIKYERMVENELDKFLEDQDEKAN